MEYLTNNSGEMDIILRLGLYAQQGLIKNNNILKQPGGVIQMCGKLTNHVGTDFETQKVGKVGATVLLLSEALLKFTTLIVRLEYLSINFALIKSEMADYWIEVYSMAKTPCHQIPQRLKAVSIS